MSPPVPKTLLVMALLCLARPAPAGCPSGGVTVATCAADSSSIEGCTNAIFFDYRDITIDNENLQRNPPNAAELLQSLQATQSDLASIIRRLDKASIYTPKSPFTDCGTTAGPDWAMVSRCMTQLKSAQNGIALLEKPEIAGTLSLNSREFLRLVYAKQATQYRRRLDAIAARWTGDPAVLCQEDYASIPACKSAIAMDTDAVRRQIFPVQQCGSWVPGQFVSASSDAADQQRHAHDSPAEIMLRQTFHFSYLKAVAFYRNRLDRETRLLAGAEIKP